MILRGTYLAIVSLVLAISTQAQIVESNLIDLKENQFTGWQTYYSSNGVEIQFSIEQCDPEIGFNEESIILKVENTTEEIVEIKWHSLLYYDGECKTCEYEEEYSNRVKIMPNTVMTGDCSIYGIRDLRYFLRFNDPNYKGVPVALTAFKLDKLQITSINDQNN